MYTDTLSTTTTNSERIPGKLLDFLQKFRRSRTNGKTHGQVLSQLNQNQFMNEQD